MGPEPLPAPGPNPATLIAHQFSIVKYFVRQSKCRDPSQAHLRPGMRQEQKVGIGALSGQATDDRGNQTEEGGFRSPAANLPSPS